MTLGKWMVAAAVAAMTGLAFTDPFPASPTGDAQVKADVTLPEPCFAPIVFVTSPTNQWFAVTGG